MIEKLLKKSDYTLKKYLTKDKDGITLLEKMLKEKEEIIPNEEKLIHSTEVCYLYVKYDKELFNFELTEEQLYTEINGDLLINYIVNSNCLGISSIVKKIKKNTSIIDKLIENGNIYLLNYLTQGIRDKLVTKDQNDEYLIEKYFNDLEIIKKLVSLYETPKDLIKICEEKSKLEILKYCSEEALMNKINKKETLLEYLLNKDIIPDKLNYIPNNNKFINFLVSKKIYNYFTNKDESTLNTKIEKNKTLLEILLNKGVIKELDFSIKNEDTIKVLYKLNKLDLINNIYTNLLIKNCKKFNINSKNTLLEYLLDNEYNFVFNEYYFDTKKEDTKIIIDELYKRKKFDIIAKSIKKEYYLYEVEPGITLLDIILQEQKDFKIEKNDINKIEIIEKIFNYNRIDLLVNIDLKLLLNTVKEKDTYLDYVLEAIKKQQIKFNLNDIYLYNYPIEVIAKFYLKIASHDMMKYIRQLQEKDLLKEYDKKRLIDELIDIDKELTLNKILTKSTISDIKIASILKSKGITLKDINIPLKEKNFTSDYLKEEHNKFGIGPIQEKGENVLNKLQNIFLSDEESDKDLIEALVIGYRQALINNYDVFIIELLKLIEIKEKNPKFRYLKSEEKSYFSKLTGAIHCNQANINTLMHETGHALHYYLANDLVPKNLKKALEEIRDDDEILKKTEIISNNYSKITENVKKIVEIRYNDYFKKYYNIQKNNEIINFLLKSKEEKKKEFKNLNIDEETLDIILNSTFTSEEYIKTQKRIFIKEQVETIIREEYGDILSISDILDGIFEGKLNSGVLKNDNKKIIKSSAGHGISYYSCKDDFVFFEMVANFSAICKSKNSTEMLNLLKDTIGKKTYNIISEFYYNNIIYNQEEKTKKL